jgi:hypothetical protein
VARKAIDLMRIAQYEGRLKIPKNELVWLDIMTDTLDDLPSKEEQFIDDQLAVADAERFLAAEYGL